MPFPAGLVEPTSDETMSAEGSRNMKIKFDIDCTPEELRSFFGLPEIRPMQEALLKDVEERMRASLKALDPETMLKTWLPAGLKGFEQLQEMFMRPDGRPARRRQEIAVPAALAHPAPNPARMARRRHRAVCMMSADPAVMRYLPSLDRAAAKEWVGRMRDHWDRHGFGQCVVELPGEASFIGVIGLNHVRWILPFTAGGRGWLAAGAALLGNGLCPGGGARRDR